MKFAEIINRLNGLNCPIAGQSWTPPEADVVAAQRVIRYLGDRRVLFHEFAWEVPEQCLRTAGDIQTYLTNEMRTLTEGSALAGSLKSIRGASRKFVDDNEHYARTRSRPDNHADYFTSLGEWRARCGVYVALIAVRYGVDVDDDLATILPAEDAGE
ncbi:MAG: hypothetical protein P4L33_06520 [Capsulimonadaceae bacterium]|nr:hypothetical protein [Capsulimonadaceae bacterium]